MTIDILPTIAELTATKRPEHAIDGKSIWPLMSGAKDAKSPHDALFFYYGDNLLEAVRSGRWKLHFPHPYRTMDGRSGGKDGRPNPYATKRTGLELYDLSADIGETKDVAAEHPDVVERLEKLADRIRAELGDSGRGIAPAALRPADRI